MIKKVFSSRNEEWLFTAFVILLTYIIGMIIEIIIVVFDHEYAEVSTLVMLIGTTMYSLFLSIALPQNFNSTISMGRTRKEFAITTLMYCIIKYGILTATAVVSHSIHELVGFNDEIGFSMVMKPEICAMFIIGLTSVEILVGTMLLRFSKKAFWVFWVIWMFMCLMPARIQSAMSKSPDSVLAKFGNWVVDSISSISKSQWMAAFIIIGIIAIVISDLFILNQDVNS